MSASILHDTDRPSRAEARRGIEHATSIAVESFSRCFRELCSRIEDDLFNLAQDEPDRTRQMRMLDAYGLVRANRDQIEKQFRRAIEAIVHQRVDPEAARAATAAAKSALEQVEMSLVEDGELEADVIVKRMVGRLRNSDHAGQTEIDDLDTRLGYLLGEDRAEDARNPFSPDVLCRAIQRACDELEAKAEVRHEILRRIELQLAPRFTSAYRDLNAYFRSVNVLPDVAAYRKQRFAQRSGSAHSTMQTTPHAARVDTRTHPPGEVRDAVRSASVPAGNASNDPAADLVTRFARHAGLRPATGDKGVSGHRASVQGATSHGADGDAGQQAAGNAGAAGSWPVIHGAMIDRLQEFLPVQTVFVEPAAFISAPLADLNMLHAVGRSARERGVPRDDEILIDLVALVVDQILLDTQVPDRIKRLIARLQVPLLRCALLDRSLFSRPEHPARVLVDTVGRSSIGWQERETADDHGEERYYQLVFDIVARIEAEFDRDLALFDEQTQRLNDFLAEQARREAERYARADEAIERAELREIADMQALIQIRDAIADIELPEDIAEFLLDPWRRVLVEASVTEVSNDTIVALRRVITDVVWSVQPKISADERHKLVAMLPPLIKQVREGFVAIALVGGEQERFFAGLMRAHANAVKVGARTEQEDRAFARFESRVNHLRIDPQAAPADLDVHVSSEAVARAAQLGDISIEVAPTPAPEIARKSVHTSADAEAIVASLTRGSWAELADRDPHKIARLRWVSPRRSTYLFTNRAGTEAISYTPELLRLHVEIGHLLVLDSGNLTERALDAIETSIATPA